MQHCRKLDLSLIIIAAENDVFINPSQVVVPPVVSQSNLISFEIVFRPDRIALEGVEFFTLGFTARPGDFGDNPILHDTFVGRIQDATGFDCYKPF